MAIQQPTANIPHMTRDYAEEEEYYNVKTDMYQDLFWIAFDIIKKINSKGSTSIDEKEQIAKEVLENASCIFPDRRVSVAEEDVGEVEHRVQLLVSKDGWFIDLGIIWVENNDKAVGMYCEHADCDIRIDYDDDEPRIEYVEDPDEKSYNNDYAVWDPEANNTNPFQENWLVDGCMHTPQCQSFDQYAEHFGIVDIKREIMQDVIDTCLEALDEFTEEKRESGEEPDFDEFIKFEMLEHCADIIPEGYDFDVYSAGKGTFRYAPGGYDEFYISCQRNGRTICESGLIRCKWVETSRKRKADEL